MIRITLVLAVAAVVVIGGCGRKNDPVKPVTSKTNMAAHSTS
jgi:uncharacterized lipoprotein